MQTQENPTDQIAEFTSRLTQFREVCGGWAEVKSLPATIKTLEARLTGLSHGLAALRKNHLDHYAQPQARKEGSVSDACAREIAARIVHSYHKLGRLEALCSNGTQCDALMRFAGNTLDLDLTTKSALTTGEIPLPAQYGSEIRELISTYGIVRRYMTPYPIGMGTAKPARMGTRPAFSSIAMSGAFPEKSPAFTFASLESHKVGGLVRVPRELDEQSIVNLGHFLARYGAIEFARLEDKWGLLADGTATFDSIKGVAQVATESGRAVTLAAGKTKPSDVTLDDLRAMRTLVNKAALSGKLSAYYLDSTWEAKLPSFKTAADQDIYRRLPNGAATLDGYPIIWTDVLTAYGTEAAASSCLAIFGALSFWWLGEHGAPRMDTSDHVFYQNDQLAVRFIEEIDFDYVANDATSALFTPAE